jgi:hypothetical protein
VRASILARARTNHSKLLALDEELAAKLERLITSSPNEAQQAQGQCF